MKRKIIKWLCVLLAPAIGLFIVLLAVTAMLYSPAFVYRVTIHGESQTTDYKIFPERIITKSEHSYEYEYLLDNTLPKLQITYQSNGQAKMQALSSIIEESDTMSFIVIKDNKIIYEQYANGYNRDSVNTSFSMAKSIDSLLIGKAIEDGYIESEDQSIADYISEFKGTSMENVTIKNLLMMRSEITYEEGDFLWFGDDTYTYWMPDLRKLALS